MTISFLLWNSVIKSEEEEDTKRNLCQTLSENGAKVENSSSSQIDSGTIFKFEIENIEDEETICNKISGQNYKGNFKLQPQFYHEIQINSTSEFVKWKSGDDQEKKQAVQQECEKIICKENVVKEVKIGKNDVTFVKLHKKDHAELLIKYISDLSNPKLKASFPKNIATTQNDSYQKSDYDLFTFYQKSDYDLVTENLKNFITEICKLLN